MTRPRIGPQIKDSAYIAFGKTFPFASKQSPDHTSSMRDAKQKVEQFIDDVFNAMEHKAQSCNYRLTPRDYLRGDFTPPDERPHSQRVREDTVVRTNTPQETQPSNWARKAMDETESNHRLTPSQKRQRLAMYKAEAEKIDKENAAKQEQAERESDPIYQLTRSEAESLPSYFQPSWQATAEETHEACRLSDGFLSGKISVEEFEQRKKTLLDNYFGRREAEKSEAAEKLKAEQAELAAERKTLRMEKAEISESTATPEPEPEVETPETTEPDGLAELAKLPPDVLAGLAKLPADALAALAKQETGQAD